ncbi:acyl-CoA thioesterase [Oceanidesulfovibrio indonesiensis]|uniref:Acyl-CoA thioesterase n=2 Tax=Oceanidesulfovibrio indonesiensis TaxID=54767 RepID=A0A7M3MD84_9BACT|nr:acyl-CoA thioesterase [Oceanidesulfovibrio indonesiensis]
MTHLVLPQDANPLGHGHGGVILKHIDTAAGMVAMRHVRGNAVTASIDRVDFIRPVFVGELVHLKANLNGVGKTSMEVGVRVEAENLTTGEVRYTNSAYLTFVALTVDGKPSEVPPLIPETEEDVRRQHEAAERRRMRLAMRCREGQ